MRPVEGESIVKFMKSMKTAQRQWPPPSKGPNRFELAPGGMTLWI